VRVNYPLTLTLSLQGRVLYPPISSPLVRRG
jgi:hypothetical protein